MSTNESTLDRIIRGIVGAIALVLAVVVGVGSVGGILMIVVGGILVVTAAVGFCPLYRILGLSTAKANKE
jgi:uncharacterized membrane protein